MFIAGPFNIDEERFHSEYQNSRFQIKKKEDCFILTILNTSLSDEATYYCALMYSAGTSLQVEGRMTTKIKDLSIYMWK